jgi:hypothetical protein
MFKSISKATSSVVRACVRNETGNSLEELCNNGFKRRFRGWLECESWIPVTGRLDFGTARDSFMKGRLGPRVCAAKMTAIAIFVFTVLASCDTLLS